MPSVHRQNKSDDKTDLRWWRHDYTANSLEKGHCDDIYEGKWRWLLQRAEFMGTSPPPYLHLPLLANHFLLWRTLPLQLFFKSESMIFIAICCRSSFCLKLERSLPVASICLPAFLLSFPESQRHPARAIKGGSYEDEILMEEQQRQIPGENFSRVSRFLSVNWRGRAEAVFMDGSWLTTDALTTLLYCEIPTIPFALTYNATPYYTSPYESIGQPLMHYPPQAAQAPSQPSLTPLNCLAGKSGFF